MEQLEKIFKNRAIYIFVWVITVFVTLVPVITATMPPGSDLSVHLARVYAIHQWSQDADLQRFYDIHWEVLPNLAFDLIVLPLLRAMSPYMAGKTFVILSVLLMFGGVALIRRHYYGRVGYLPLLTGLFIYNAPVAIGLTNFYFGVGFALIGFALWLVSEPWRWWTRLAAMAVFSLALFFTHLLVLCLFGLTILLHRLQQFYHTRKINLETDGVMAGQFVLPAILLFFIHPPTHGTETVFGPLMTRVEAIISPVLYFNDFDVAVGVSLIVIIVWLVLSKRLTIITPMKFTMLFLTVLSILMPEAILGIWLVHVRLPILASLLCLATMDVKIPERGLRYLLVGALILFTVLRLDKVNHSITTCDLKKIEFKEALSSIPRGAKILPVIEDGARTGDCLAGNYWHMPALAVIERSAYYPMMFVTKWPLNITPALQQFSQKKPRPASPQVLFGDLPAIGEAKWNKVVAEKWRSEFEYLIWLHPGVSPSKLPDNLQPIQHGSFFTFYKIQK